MAICSSNEVEQRRGNLDGARAILEGEEAAAIQVPFYTYLNARPDF
jgi:hypothetical protein